MTKWARIRKLRERKRAEEASRRAEEALSRSEAEGTEVKLVEPEKISENIQHPQEIEKIEGTKTFSPNTILSQIPRYVYLLAFFTLLSGIFFPLISSQTSFDVVIQGIAALFLGLVGAILLFKGITSDKRRGLFIAIGFVLISISLAVIFVLQEHTRIY
jgi:hypothetical protein